MDEGDDSGGVPPQLISDCKPDGTTAPVVLVSAVTAYDSVLFFWTTFCETFFQRRHLVADGREFEIKESGDLLRQGGAALSPSDEPSFWHAI